MYFGFINKNYYIYIYIYIYKLKVVIKTSYDLYSNNQCKKDVNSTYQQLKTIVIKKVFGVPIFR